MDYPRVIYKDLQNSDNLPRVHGNGFIQLDLPDGFRLHIWDDEIPKQKVNTSKHDHAFGFESTVICGQLKNITYHIAPSYTGAWMVHTPQRRDGTEDTKLVSTGERVGISRMWPEKIETGQSYSFAPQVFHETLYEGTTATILRKTERLDVVPRILVPYDEEPDNEFDRDSFDEGLLWSIIKRTLANV